MLRQHPIQNRVKTPAFVSNVGYKPAEKPPLLYRYKTPGFYPPVIRIPYGELEKRYLRSFKIALTSYLSRRAERERREPSVETDFFLREILPQGNDAKNRLIRRGDLKSVPRAFQISVANANGKVV